MNSQHVEKFPKEFDVIGSHDCGKVEGDRFRTNLDAGLWTTLLHVEDAGFSMGVGERKSGTSLDVPGVRHKMQLVLKENDKYCKNVHKQQNRKKQME